MKRLYNIFKSQLVVRGKHRDQRGFSLIELMIVMAILVLIATVVGPEFWGKFGTAKQKTAKTQIEMLMAALDAYRLDVGSYPSEQEGLEALISDPGGEKWDGPYLRKKIIPKDPWDRPYQYKSPGDHGDIDIFSYGADDKEGGEKENKDIVSWE